MATKIQDLWQKALKIGEAEQKERLRISIMESVLNYAVPDLMHNFLQKHPDTQLMIRNQYSKDALSYVERGELDVAIIRDVQPSPGLVISSLFSDPWVMICGRGVYQLPDVISPTRLDGKQQLYLLGSNDLDWNKHWFPENKNASVISHTLSVIGKNTFESAKWAIVPYTVARHLKGIYDIELHYFTESPPPRVIYLALRNQEPTQIVKEFLFQLYEELRKVSGITLLF